MRKMRLLILMMCLPARFDCHASVNAGELETVKQWIAHRGSISSVSASFVQERHLKALKRPIINSGKLWFKSPRLFRWQIGEPAESVAISKNGEILLLRPRKKTGERYSDNHSHNSRQSPGMLFFEIGFPRDYKEFIKRFTVTGLSHLGDSYFVSLKFNDRRSNMAIRKVVFEIDSKTYLTQSMEMRFRDASSIKTSFSSVLENAHVKDSVFEFDLNGYRLKGTD